MKDLIIRELLEGEAFPYDLLYLADPSQEPVEDYTKRGNIYLACSEGQIVREYVLLKTRPFTVELVNVAVKEEYWGKGIGKALVLHAIETASKKGAKIIEVGTGDAGISQLALYQKCGFSMDYIDKDFFPKHYPEKIVENGLECRHMIRLRIDL